MRKGRENSSNNERGDIVFMYTTLPRGKGMETAKVLIEEGLAMCANTFRIKSVYKWKGRVVEEEEEGCMLKVHPSVAEKARKRLEELHPYEVPFIGMWQGSANLSYLGWWENEVTDLER